jgi:hypothetical protein
VAERTTFLGRINGKSVLETCREVPRRGAGMRACQIFCVKEVRLSLLLGKY